jgi:hypothetical protein
LTGSITETNGVTANLVLVNNRNEICVTDTFPGVTDCLIFKRVNSQQSGRFAPETRAVSIGFPE